MKKRKVFLSACLLGATLIGSVPAFSQGVQCLLIGSWLGGGRCEGANLAIPFMDPMGHEIKACTATAGISCVDTPASLWLDPGMIAATGLDMLATDKVNQVTVKASKAIEELKKKIGADDNKGNDNKNGGGSGSGGSGNGAAADAETAAVFLPEDIIPIIELENVSSGGLFGQLRTAIENYLFKTGTGIEGECAKTAEQCARTRQSEWLLTSLALSSSTADKILSTAPSLQGHLEGLVSSFNSQTDPAASYNALANMVLATHGPVNDANVLLARDLEAQGLVAAYESGFELFKREESETEE